jgi:D-serine deaminase-like pyridoxal phosphate-dependent protein
MNQPPRRNRRRHRDIDTPALVIDLDALDRNIAKMAEFSRTTGIRVRRTPRRTNRPPSRYARSRTGAVGQCVQKVGEAEALVRGGVTDILVSNEVVGERKLRRLAALAKDATIALCFDSASQVDVAVAHCQGLRCRTWRLG